MWYKTTVLDVWVFLEAEKQRPECKMAARPLPWRTSHYAAGRCIFLEPSVKTVPVWGIPSWQVEGQNSWAWRETDLLESLNVQQGACLCLPPLLRGQLRVAEVWGRDGGAGMAAESVQRDQKLSKLPLQQWRPAKQRIIPKWGKKDVFAVTHRPSGINLTW